LEAMSVEGPSVIAAASGGIADILFFPVAASLALLQVLKQHLGSVAGCQVMMCSIVG
jgi:hypothetical protein